jgi:hypothetical protein
MPASKLEIKFLKIWKALHPEIPLIPEYMGIEKRKFRFDFADPSSLVAVEIQGGIFKPQKCGHNSGQGLLRDYEKLNLAQSQGWTVFQLSATMINPKWLEIIAQTINKKNDQKR